MENQHSALQGQLLGILGIKDVDDVASWWNDPSDSCLQIPMGGPLGKVPKEVGLISRLDTIVKDHLNRLAQSILKWDIPGLLLYTISVDEAMDHWHVVNLAAAELENILKKSRKVLLGHLTFDHIPLFKRLDHLFFPRLRVPLTSKELDVIPAIFNLAKRSRPFFAISDAAQYILDNTQHDMNPLIPDIAIRPIIMTVAMMPSQIPNGQIRKRLLNMFSPISDEPNASVWAINSVRIECFLLLIAKRLIKFAEVSDDYKKWFAFISAISPKHYKMPASATTTPKLNQKFYIHHGLIKKLRNLIRDGPDYIGKIIAYLVANDKSALSILGTYFNSLDTFCHPSNSGSWSRPLNSMFVSQTSYLAKIHAKRAPIDAATLDCYVGLIWPLVKKLAFGKSNTLAALMLSWGEVFSIFSYLSFLSPKTLNVLVLKMASETLLSLSEPHRVLVCIGMIEQMSRSELERENSEDLIASLFSILQWCVEGLDPNDHAKTMATIRLFFAIFLSCPFDSRTAEVVGLDALETLIASFLDKTFAYVSGIHSQAVQHSNSVSSSDGALERALGFFLSSTLNVFFQQLSKDFYCFAIERVEEFVRHPRSECSLSLVKYIVEACKGRFHGDVSKRLLSSSLKEAIGFLSTGAGTDASKTDDSLNGLLWHLTIILGSTRFSQDDCLEFSPDYVTLFQHLLATKQKRCIGLLSEILKVFLKAIAIPYPLSIEGWSDNQNFYMGPRDGIAFSSVMIKECKLKWYLPDPNHRREAESIWNKMAFDLKAAWEKIDSQSSFAHVAALRSLLVAGSWCDFKGSSIEDWMVPMLRLASDEKMPVELRSSIMDFSGLLSGGEFDQDVMFSKYPALVNKQYPKQNSFPSLHQLAKCSLAFTRAHNVLNHPRHIPPNDGQVFEFLKCLAVDHSNSVSLMAIANISILAKNFPSVVTQWIFDALIPQLDQWDAKDDYKLIASMHLFRFAEIFNLLTSPSLQWKVFRAFARLQMRENLAKVKNFQESLSSNLSRYSEPTLAFGMVETSSVHVELFDEASSLFNSCKNSHSVQLGCCVWVGSIGMHCVDIELLKRICHFLLICATSDHADVRSVAVNRGIGALHRLARLASFCDMTVDWDTGVGNRSFSPIYGNYLGINQPDLLELLSNFIKWQSQEKNEEQIPKYRSDPCEFIQSLVEVTGTDSFPAIFSLYSQNRIKGGRLGEERAACEGVAGIVRSIVLAGENNRQDEVIKWGISEIECGSIEMAECWYQCARFISGNLSGPNVQPLFDSVSEALLSSEKSTTISLLLSFLSGLLKGCPHLSPSHLFTHLGLSDYDLVRQSYTNFAFHLARISTKVHRDRIFADLFGQFPSESAMKSAVLLLEKLSWDPAVCATGEIWPSYIEQLSSACESSNVEIQKRSGHVLRLLADLVLSQFEVAKIKGFLKTLFLLLERKTPSSPFRRLSIELVRIIVGRNFGELKLQGFLTEALSFAIHLLSDTSVDVAMEASKLVSYIFHCDHQIAANLATETKLYLDRLRLKVRDIPSAKTRQGAVLQATALILSCPYSIPDWLPPLLTSLTYYLNDCLPVQPAIQKCFSEFKRTHEDTWIEDREKFTESELDSISELLVAPSYYA